MDQSDTTRTEPRCRILQIGTIETTLDGREYAAGWVMDCEHSTAPGVSIDTETGTQIVGGYTIAELKAIALRGRIDHDPL